MARAAVPEVDVGRGRCPMEPSSRYAHDAGGVGRDPHSIYGHSVHPSSDGRLRSWRAGQRHHRGESCAPAHRAYRGRIVSPATSDGDAPWCSYHGARRRLFAADEGFCKTSTGTDTATVAYAYESVISPNPMEPGEYAHPTR